MKVAYLGSGETSFTGIVTRREFPNDELIPILPITDVVYAVEGGQVDFGVIPFQNILECKVFEGLDALVECNNTHIVQEIFSPIVHCIGALKNHGKIKRIMSKDTALAQCGKYLRKNYPDAKKKGTDSTDDAVKSIVELGLMDSAAIASEESMSSKLEIIAKDIVPNNRTRFAIIGTNCYNFPTGDDKTFLAIYPPKNIPGTLFDILKTFKDSNINLEGINERRNLKEGGYYFYVEINGHAESEVVKNAMEHCKGYVKILGSYENTHWDDEKGGANNAKENDN